MKSFAFKKPRIFDHLERLLAWSELKANMPIIKPFLLALIFSSVVITAISYSLSPWYQLVINKSESLPGTLYYLDKTATPVCGNTTIIQMPDDSRFYKGQRMIKIIKGCEGDVITRSDQTIFINRKSVGSAMAFSTDGKYQLFTISEGIIPRNKVYLSALHAKSYDSRYASFGLRGTSELLGTAYKIF